MNMIYISLTEDEILHLDGFVRKEIQDKIDEIKLSHFLEIAELSKEEAKFIAATIKEAELNGKLICRFTRIHRCPVTGKGGEYSTHKRTSRYHRKGDIDYRKPICITGVELAERSIYIQDRVILGCCVEFWETIKPKLSKYLKNVKAEIPEEITGYPSHWRKFYKMECKECGWKGNEGQILRVKECGLLNSYQCPSCKIKEIFPQKIITMKEFDLISMEQEQ